MIRNALRHAALDALSSKHYIQSMMGLKADRPAVQFVLFHSVRPEEESRFDKFLDWLSTEFDVVSYSDAVNSLTRPATNKKIAAISFDDGLKNNFAAARIMKQHGLSGCFFVCPSIVGETDEATIARFCKDRMLFEAPDSFMNWDELETLRKQGHEIGNHSLSHLYMMDLSNDQFDEEVEKARDEIRSRLGNVEHFAWPYGRFFHFQPERVRRVFGLGHVSCASGERGAHQISTGQSEFCLRRDSLDINWPLRHCKYFLNSSSSNPLSSSEAWPEA